MKTQNKKIELTIVLLAFMFYFIWSITLPFNTGPDEYMRYQIPQFIFSHGTLPHGGDPSIRNPIWGISYGFTPMLSYIISAFFMWVVNIFNKSEFALLIAARFVSVICSTGTVFMCIQIGKKAFKGSFQYLFAILVGFLPQFVFVSSYVNNDAIAIFSTSLIIYFWLSGLDTKWNIKCCIGLAIGISLCGLSYYNAYGYILCSVLLFFVSVLYMNRDNKIGKYKILIQKGSLITVIVLALIGWWFIRSYIIYDGDILGLNTSNKFAQMFAQDQYKPSNRQTPFRQGVSIVYMLVDMGWLKTSCKSFIGMFDYMSLPIYNWMYHLYYLITIVGLSELFVKLYNFLWKKININKKLALINFGMVMTCIITVALSVFYSYTSDYQPQGRYCMPIILPVMFFSTLGFKNLLQKFTIKKKINKSMIYCFITGYVLVAFIIYTNIIVPTYYK